MQTPALTFPASLVLFAGLAATPALAAPAKPAASTKAPTAPRIASSAAPAPSPAPRATAQGGDDDWESF